MNIIKVPYKPMSDEEVLKLDKINERNKLIKAMLSKPICSEDLFGVFALFANGISSFDDVEKICKFEGVDFDRLCRSQGLSPDLIRP